MSKYKKLLGKILIGTFDSSITFTELVGLLIRLGFKQRIRGDHHVFYRDDIQEIINLQPKSGKAKPYQVRQIRDIILKYNLGDENV